MVKPQQHSPFDSINSGIEFDPVEQENIQKTLEAEYQRRDYMIHKVFAQTEAGRDLLQYWIESCIINKPVAIKGEQHDLIDVGINQGMQDFVRGIHLTCKKVEENL